MQVLKHFEKLSSLEIKLLDDYAQLALNLASGLQIIRNFSRILTLSLRSLSNYPKLY